MMNRDDEPHRNGKPQSLEQPWWLGKAKRQHILLKFVVISVFIALLILGLVIAMQP
jgi:hypothetical protein